MYSGERSVVRDGVLVGSTEGSARLEVRGSVGVSGLGGGDGSGSLGRSVVLTGTLEFVASGGRSQAVCCC
jgi:hypothetical protein